MDGPHLTQVAMSAPPTRIIRVAGQCPPIPHGPLLRAFLSGRVARASLDDLDQDVGQKVWARLPDRYRPGNFRAWLHQVARDPSSSISTAGEIPKPRSASPTTLVPEPREVALPRGISFWDRQISATTLSTSSGVRRWRSTVINSRKTPHPGLTSRT